MRSPTAPDILEATEKRKRAIALRKAHYSYQEIADELGLSKTRVRQYVAEAMDENRKETAEEAAEIREMELLRLDELLKAWFPMAKAGDDKAAGIVLKAQERRAKLLGLDAPVRQELTGKDGGPMQTVNAHAKLDNLTDAQLEQLSAILLAAQAPKQD